MGNNNATKASENHVGAKSGVKSGSPSCCPIRSVSVIYRFFSRALASWLGVLVERMNHEGCFLAIEELYQNVLKTQFCY